MKDFLDCNCCGMRIFYCLDPKPERNTMFCAYCERPLKIKSFSEFSIIKLKEFIREMEGRLITYNKVRKVQQNRNE